MPQYRIDVDREKAKALGIPITTIFDTMQSSFGSLYVNDFKLYGRTYRVSLSSEADFRETPDDLRHVFVRTDNGVMVPLNELVTVTRIIGPDTVDRFNVFPAAKILGSPAPGYSSGQAIAAMQQVVAATLRNDYTIGWTGSAYQELATAGTGHLGFAFGLLMVFLILAAQYERWSLPLAVLTRCRSPCLARCSRSGCAARERRLFPDRAGDADRPCREERHPDRRVRLAAPSARACRVYDAAIEAARLRFRPIVMTSLAFILGVLPLALSTGAGSAAATRSARA